MCRRPTPPQSSARPRPADHLLHIDAGCGRYLSPVNLPVNTLGHRPSTKVVDQNGGVENDQLEVALSLHGAGPFAVETEPSLQDLGPTRGLVPGSSLEPP